MEVFPKVTIEINEALYLKNPESSELGRKIIDGSIEMINDVGFEDFTFRKLGKEIESTEASIYRYFESKHKLLLYLTSWYWAWQEYRLLFAIANITSPKEKLSRAIRVLTTQLTRDSQSFHVNEVKLQRIVINESSKAYLTKEVDEENKDGLFSGYKQLVARVSQIITEVDPDYKYPNMLISTVIEGSHHQRFFAEHLPRLTNTHSGEDSISEFYHSMVFSILKNS